MVLTEINSADIPVVPVRTGLTCVEVTIDALTNVGTPMVTYGLNVNDRFEFPATKADLKVIQRQVRPNSTAYEYLVLGLKNGKPAWLSLSNLRRRDHKNQPVHPLAEALHGAESDAVRLEMCLGKTITSTENIEYQEAVFENGMRTDGTKPRTVAKLMFA